MECTCFCPQGDEQIDRIILTGFRATGKSAVGKVLAAKLGYDFIDTDTVLCCRLKSSVANYVAENGWQKFRQKERELLVELGKRKKTVIATGGGCVLHLAQWSALRQGSVAIWLKANLETIIGRMASDVNSQEQRPSLTEKTVHEEVKSLLAEREPFYRKGSDLTVDTDNVTIENVVIRVIEMLQQQIERKKAGKKYYARQ